MIIHCACTNNRAVNETPEGKRGVTYLTWQRVQVFPHRQVLFHLRIRQGEVEYLRDRKRLVLGHIQVLDLVDLDVLFLLGEELLHEVDVDRFVRRKIVTYFDRKKAMANFGEKRLATYLNISCLPLNLAANT